MYALFGFNDSTPWINVYIVQLMFARLLSYEFDSINTPCNNANAFHFLKVLLNCLFKFLIFMPFQIPSNIF